MSTSNLTSTSAEDEMEAAIEVTIPDQKPAPIPLFLKKLWKMVNDTGAEQIIGWNSSGDGFIIYDQVKFVTELLPQYFKHNNLSSFIRQLNFYDFHKVANVEKNEMEFAHSCFLKDLPETLAFITRKVSNVKSRNIQGVKQENINEVLAGIKEMRSRHNLIENELKMLKQENAALWNEINTLRIKYSKQTKVINKLIHFLISYMHSHQNTFGKTNITTVSRKLDQKHLKNTPQLFQIDYRKPLNADSAAEKSHRRIPGSSKRATITTPNNVKSSSPKSSMQPKQMNNKAKIFKESTSKKASTMSSYPAETISEASPEMYNVTSPSPQDNVFVTSPYPIEEIVTEVDPNLEETSVYTVKFPKNDVNPNQPTHSLNMPLTNINSLNIVTNQAGKSLPPGKTHDVLKNKGKLTHGKRKLSNDNSTFVPIQKPKTINTSKRGLQSLKLIIPKSNQTMHVNKNKDFKQPIPKSSRKGHISTKKKFDDNKQTLMLPQPSPVKPEVVLENLFSEIENSVASQPVSDILSHVPSDSDNFGLNLETDPAQILLENPPEVILSEQDHLQDAIDNPSEMFTTLTGGLVDPEGSIISGNPSSSAFTTNQEALESQNIQHSILKCELVNDIENELENYSEDMLSSFSQLPEVHSPSRELYKYNIIENPKENLGLYLDNTQIQLSNIQDLLNDLNSEELYDLFGCFNVDEENENSEQRGNQILSVNDLVN